MTKRRVCFGCVPPERHLGCHENCDRYQKEREEAEKRYMQRKLDNQICNLLHDGMKRNSTGGCGMNVKMYKGGKQR